MDKAGKGTKFLYEITEIFAIALVIIIIVTAFLVRVINVSGTSMEKTLQDGNRLIISSFNYSPQRGDIIVSSQPNSRERLLIKRVIAIEGDEININWTTGDVSINGEIIVEDYINGDSYVNINGNYRDEFPLTVPEGYVFVMGDNRGVSWDSRYKEVGMIRTDYLLGKAVLRLNDFKSF